MKKGAGVRAPNPPPSTKPKAAAQPQSVAAGAPLGPPAKRPQSSGTQNQAAARVTATWSAEAVRKELNAAEHLLQGAASGPEPCVPYEYTTPNATLGLTFPTGGTGAVGFSIRCRAPAASVDGEYEPDVKLHLTAQSASASSEVTSGYLQGKGWVVQAEAYRDSDGGVELLVEPAFGGGTVARLREDGTELAEANSKGADGKSQVSMVFSGSKPCRVAYSSGGWMPSCAVTLEGNAFQYAGPMKDGLRHGAEGAMSIGEVSFRGAWEQDHRHGGGTMTFPAVVKGSPQGVAASLTGVWSKGARVGESTLALGDPATPVIACSHDFIETTLYLSSGKFRGRWAAPPTVAPPRPALPATQPQQEAEAQTEAFARGWRRWRKMVALRAAILEALPAAKTATTIERARLHRDVTAAHRSLSTRRQDISAAAKSAADSATQARMAKAAFDAGQRRIQEKQREAEGLAAKNVELQQRLSTVNSETERVLGKIEALEADAPKSSTVNSTEFGTAREGEALRDGLLAEAKKLSAAAAEKSAQVRLLKAQVDQRTKELRPAEDQLKTRLDHLANCRELVGRVQGKLAQQKSEYEAILRETMAARDDKLHHAAELAAKEQTLRDANDELTDGIAKAERASEKLAAENVAADRRREELERRRGEAQDAAERVEQLRSSISRAEEHLRMIEEQRRALMEEGAALRRQAGEQERLEAHLRSQKLDVERMREEGDPSAASLEQRLQRSIDNLRSRIQATEVQLQSAAPPEPVTPPTVPISPTPDEKSKLASELARLLEALRAASDRRAQLQQRSEELAARKLEAERRLSTSAKRSAPKERLEKEVYSLSAEEMKTLIRQTKTESDEIASSTNALRAQLSALQSEYEELKRTAAARAAQSSAVPASKGVDPRVKLLQTEVDRLDALASELRMRAKRVQQLESKLATARETVGHLADCREVRRNTSLRKRDSASSSWL